MQVNMRNNELYLDIPKELNISHRRSVDEYSHCTIHIDKDLTKEKLIKVLSSNVISLSPNNIDKACDLVINTITQNLIDRWNGVNVSTDPYS